MCCSSGLGSKPGAPAARRLVAPVRLNSNSIFCRYADRIVALTDRAKRPLPAYTASPILSTFLFSWNAVDEVDVLGDRRSIGRIDADHADDLHCSRPGVRVGERFG